MTRMQTDQPSLVRRSLVGCTHDVYPLRPRQAPGTPDRGRPAPRPAHIDPRPEPTDVTKHRSR
jgi:hypothetical protein